jgi:hypothetical protein
MTEVARAARRAVTLAVLAALGAWPAAHAADASPGANALRDAQQLVACLRALDAPCAARYTDTRYLEAQGATRAELIAAADELNRNLKSLGAKYTRFELEPPWTPFAGDGHLYTFVPYTQTLEAGDKAATVRAYFIGISDDAGASWTFVDGIHTTPGTIRDIIPGYSGAPLPPVSVPAPPPAGPS